LTVADFWTHNLDPVALHLVGPLAIRWYGLAYLAGLAWGWWMVVRWAKAGRCPLAPSQVGDFVLAGGLGMIIGGRLGYCLIYGRDHLMADPLYLIKLWEGGMASHGGIIGLAAGAWWHARSKSVSWAVLTDLVAATAPMGIALGRAANFINGELWGKPGTVPWAVIFPDASLVDGLRVPRHPSQLYEMLAEGVILLAVILPIHARHRRPGVTTGALLALYAVGRFVTEIWREPDVGHPPLWGWMNKGQLLSLPVLVVGLVVLWWAWRRGAKPDLYRAPSA
jgi:phosphatidylglycerol:prolipoprotein diacylglycerol transferase